MMETNTTNTSSANVVNESGESNAKIKKGSYPSRQRRFGPAPLASFEDLPSDDQRSPDFDSTEFGEMHYTSPDPLAIETALELDSSLLLQQRANDVSPTQTITPTCISPPMFLSQKRGSDTASQNTLTMEARSDSTPLVDVSKSGSFSSLKPDKPESFSIAGQTKGSFNSLLAIPDSHDGQSPTSKRKSSWTDIFFPGRARSKSSSSSPRKSPTGEKKKTGIFKILNFGRKSPSKELNSPSDTSQAIRSGGEMMDTPRVSVTDTSENEPHEELIIHSPTNEPKASEQDILGILEAANSQMIQTPIEDFQIPLAAELPPLNLRKTLKRRESTIDDEVQSLPEILPSSRSKERDLLLNNVNKNVETVVVQIESCSARDERDSSESEIGLSESVSKIKQKVSQNKSGSDDDFEAENLLTQESIDYDDTSGSDNTAIVCTEIVKSPTRRERLDITTIPIERPRSTTPINIVPLEAYIRSTSISPDPNLEKIKLSLPGEQFTCSARAKSPRKSNPSIWFDFCEKGLQSPRSLRKQRANSCIPNDSNSQLENPFSLSNIDAFNASQPLTPSPANLSLDDAQDVDSDNKWPGFGDNFVNYDNLLVSTNGLSNDSEIQFSCQCDCNVNASAVTNGNNTASQNSDSLAADDNSNNKNCSSLSTAEHEYMEDQPLVSPCHCLCHRRADFALSLWKTSLTKQESVSSDISSASSRLIGSSSSVSKCSPSEETPLQLNS